MGCILKPCADKVIPFSILGMYRGYGGTIHADSWFAAFRALDSFSLHRGPPSTNALSQPLPEAFRLRRGACHCLLPSGPSEQECGARRCVSSVNLFVRRTLSHFTMSF